MPGNEVKNITLVRAVPFSARKHRNLRRKDANASPYINHPIALAGVLVTEDGIDIEHPPHLSREAKLVRLADKICNLRDVHGTPPAGWSAERKEAYFAWAATMVRELCGVDPRLEPVFDAEVVRGGELRG